MPANSPRPRVIRGQLTTDILMSMAATRAIDLRWSDEVMGEARDHRPDGVSEEAIQPRFRHDEPFPPARQSFRVRAPDAGDAGP